MHSSSFAGEHLDIVKWWNARYDTQPDLARFALDILAVPQ
jgi:hypothetical protein